MQVGISIIIVCTLVCFGVTDACYWDDVYQSIDVYNGHARDVHYWYMSSDNVTGFSLDVDVPEANKQWLDVVWSLGMYHGRTTAFGDVVIYKQGLQSDRCGSILNVTLVFGSGTVSDVPMKIRLWGPEQSTCIKGKDVDRSLEVRAVKGKRQADNTPKWVSLTEIRSAEYAFVWPIVSRYGINTVALAVGSEVGQNHEYLQLSEYERHIYALIVPGLHFSGPSYPTLVPEGGNYYQGRQIFKYSKRDAAWVLWEFNTKKPIWNGDHDADYWKHRTCTVPITHPGLMFDHTD